MSQRIALGDGHNGVEFKTTVEDAPALLDTARTQLTKWAANKAAEAAIDDENISLASMHLRFVTRIDKDGISGMAVEATILRIDDDDPTVGRHVRLRDLAWVAAESAVTQG